MNRAAFTADDLDLLLDVLECNPSAAAAAEATKYIEDVCDYPIEDLSAFANVADQFGDKENRVPLGDCIVGMELAEQYIPTMAFPLERRDQLLSALLCAFEAARIDLVDRSQMRQRELARRGLLGGDADG